MTDRMFQQVADFHKGTIDRINSGSNYEAVLVEFATQDTREVMGVWEFPETNVSVHGRGNSFDLELHVNGNRALYILITDKKQLIVDTENAMIRLIVSGMRYDIKCVNPIIG